MSNKTVLVIESNYGGSGALAIRHAKDHGFRTQFMCRSPEEYQKLSLNPLDVADEVTVTDTFDIGKLIHAVDGRDDYAAVLAYDDPSVLQAAVLGGYLRLPYTPPPSGVARTRFKDRLRAALTATPWQVRHEVIPLTVTRSPIGYPCVVKPVDVAGNYGVTVCRSEDDFLDAIETLRSFTSRPYAHGYLPHQLALVEEYIPGQEFSAEMAWSASQRYWRLVGFTTKELSSQDRPIEVEHVFPYDFEPSLARSITSQLTQCLAAIGLHSTLVHVEFRLNGDKISIIEVNCRPAGGRINDLVKYALGTSLIEFHVAAHLGIVDELLTSTAPASYAGIRFLLPPHPGVIERFFVDPPLDREILDVHTDPAPIESDEFITADSRIAHVVTRGTSADHVSRLLKENISRIHTCYAESESQPRR